MGVAVEKEREAGDGLPRERNAAGTATKELVTQDCDPDSRKERA